MDEQIELLKSFMNNDELSAEYIKTAILPPKNRVVAEYVKCASAVRSIDETLMQLNTVESIGNIEDDLKQVRRMAEE